MFKRIISVILVAVLAMSVMTFGASAKSTVLFGDVDNDGKVNSADSLLALQFATGLKSYPKKDQAIMDVDASGSVNSSDALLMLQVGTALKSITKTDASTLKVTKVDPAFASEDGYSFTLVMKDEDLGEVNMLFSTDGKSKVISTKVLYNGILPVEIRMLHKDGKNYQVVPGFTYNFGITSGSVPGYYSDLDTDVALYFDSYSKLFTADVVYSHTKEATMNGKKHVCEVFYGNNDSVFEYYFLDGNLEYLRIANDKTDETLDIYDLEDKADSTRLVIPADCEYKPAQ